MSIEPSTTAGPDSAGTPTVQVPRSGFPGNHWPALPRPADAMVLSVMWQLEQSQWWPAEILTRWQLRQLAALLTHASRESPFYRDRLRASGVASGGEITVEQWREIPVLTRRDLQSAGPTLVSRTPPAEHGRTQEVSTSGSTGEPVRVLWNSVTSLMSSALTLRDHLWQGRDFSGKVAVIRRLQPEAAAAARDGRSTSWGGVFPSGPIVFLDIGNPVADAVRWLADQAPDYLMTYPTYFLELLHTAQALGIPLPPLRQVLAVGEVVDADLRMACQQACGARLVDMYSCQEVGMMALEAPQGTDLLVQAEAVFLEVLRDDGTPCSEGEVGRVVVTPMHNFAMPLIRYELGDHAEVGPPSSCGRGLPVLRRILGRTRNMIVMPDGGKVWVRLSDARLESIGPLRRLQLAQLSTGALEARVIPERAFRRDEESTLIAGLQKAIGAAMPIQIVYLNDFPRSASGKFEDVVCEMREPTG